jgi:hypothetical protein
MRSTSVLHIVVGLGHPGPQDVRHAGGIFLGLLSDVFGQHRGFLSGGGQRQRIERFGLLLLAQRRLLG